MTHIMGLLKVCLLTGVTLLLMREERRRGVAIVLDRLYHLLKYLLFASLGITSNFLEL